MDHFISIIFGQQISEENISEVLNTVSGNKLTETIIDYEVFETEDNEYVVRIYTPLGLSESDSDEYVDMLAEKLYTQGHNNFEVEISMDQPTITETTRNGDAASNAGILDYDVVEDLLVFMRNDSMFYRKYLYPMLLDIQQKLQLGAKYNKKDMVPIIDRAVKMYISTYNLGVHPNTLLSLHDKRECINRLLKDEIGNFKKRVY